jgi:hypothetical protein
MMFDLRQTLSGYPDPVIFNLKYQEIIILSGSDDDLVRLSMFKNIDKRFLNDPVDRGSL